MVQGAWHRCGIKFDGSRGYLHVSIVFKSKVSFASHFCAETFAQEMMAEGAEEEALEEDEACQSDNEDTI